MFLELNDLLKWDLLNDNGDSTIVTILDTLECEGSFLINHFLSFFLRCSKQNTQLIAFSQVLNHYNLICKKMGLDLASYQKKKQFSFVDSLSKLLTNFFPVSSNSVKSKLCPDFQFSLSESNNLENLLEIIFQYFGNETTEPCIIIDDINVLLNVGVSVNEVINFLRKVRAFLDSRRGKLVLLVHVDEYSKNEDIKSLVLSTVKSSNYIISTNALKSGSSREIEGEISICSGPRGAKTFFTSKSLHFKIQENNVKFFGKGLANNIL
jgi:hypothetical protein